MNEPDQYRLTDDNIDRVVSMCKSLITANSPDDAESLQSAVELLGQMAKKMPAEQPVSDGGPAFPNKDELGNMIAGMSLRDYFAGQALTGWLSDPHVLCRRDEDKLAVTKQCYLLADAMLKARQQ
jgi:hypothetical protein